MRILSILTAILLSLFQLKGDIKSKTGSLTFDPNNDSSTEMTLNSTGLGIGVTPAANLHVQGNAVLNGNVTVGSSSMGQSTLSIAGTVAYAVESVTTASANIGDYSYVIANTLSAGSNISLTLPSASNSTGREITIKSVATDNIVTINSQGGLIDGEYIINLSGYNAISLMSDGTNWSVISENGTFTAGDFTDDGLSKILWLDAADIDGDGVEEGSSESGLESGNVLSWVNKVNSSGNAAGIVGGNLPLYVNNAVNGHSVLRFDGVDDYLATSENITATTGSLFLVFSPLDLVPGDIIFDIKTNGSNFERLQMKGQHLYLYFRKFDKDDVQSYFGKPVSLGNLMLYNLNFGSDGFTEFINGHQIYSSSSDIALDQAQPMYIGSSNSPANFANVDVAEILVYNETLSTSKRQQISQVLGNKWG